MSKHNTAAHRSIARITPMTREGVSDPLDLSPEGQLDHAKRFGGPGTRSKNPTHYDKNAHLSRKAA